MMKFFDKLPLLVRASLVGLAVLVEVITLIILIGLIMWACSQSPMISIFIVVFFVGFFGYIIGET